MKKIICIFFITLLALFSGCKKIAIDKKLITVSILPQKYFVQKITGNLYKINVMVGPGHDPHSYEPSSRQMVALSRSALYFVSGHLQFEKNYLDKFKSINSRMKIYDTSRGVDLLKGEVNDEEVKGKSRHDHAHGIDPHIWLSPLSATIIVKNIFTALCEHDPANKQFFEKNYLLFLEELQVLDSQIKITLKNIRHRKFIVFHPTWAYFARDYNLIQVPVQIDGKSPSAKQIKKIIDLARAENIRVIFIQKQFSVSSIEAIIEDINGRIVQLDPLAYNWKNNLLRVVSIFKKEL